MQMRKVEQVTRKCAIKWKIKLYDYINVSKA